MRKTKDCPGFKIQQIEMDVEQRKKIRYDGDNVYRSVDCSGKLQRKKGVVRCSRCREAKETAESGLRLLNLRNELCNGIEREEFDDMIAGRRWETDRREFSLVRIYDGRLFSRKCGAKKSSDHEYCDRCRHSKALLRKLSKRDKRRGNNESNRLLRSNLKYLSANDKIKKKSEIRKRRQQSYKRLRAAAKEMMKIKSELKKFRPEDEVNRKAAAAIVDHLNKETAKVNEPKCRWTLEDGTECVEQSPTIKKLQKHVDDVHLKPLTAINSGVPPNERRFPCRWLDCGRKKPFNYRRLLRRHLRSHTGSDEDEQRLAVTRCQLTNSNRHKNGRRFCKTTKTVAEANYRNKFEWDRFAKFGLPAPSGKLVRSLKNIGGVEPGVDGEVLKMMASIAEKKPYLKHGVLVWDEVYIRPTVTIHSSTKLLSGLAEDRPGEMAKTVVVFQWVSLFSNKRFIQDVAWWPCASLNKDSLVDWFLEVGHVLETYGLHVHAILSDGAAINRGLQATLKEHYGDEKTKFDMGITSPFSDVVRRLFIISDPSHALKKIRASWYARKRNLLIKTVAENFVHDYTFQWLPVKFRHLIQLYELQKQQQLSGLRVDKQLTERHVVLESFGKMDVGTAIDSFSRPIELAMKDVPDSEGTRQYIRIGQSLWSAMGSSRTHYSYASTQRIRGHLKTVGDALDDWYRATEAKAATARAAAIKLVTANMSAAAAKPMTKPIRAKIRKAATTCGAAKAKAVWQSFITRECYEDTNAVCRGVPALIREIFSSPNLAGVRRQFKARMITQDLLERDFGYLRSMSGRTNNPTVDSLAYNLRTRNMNRLNRFILKNKN